MWVDRIICMLQWCKYFFSVAITSKNRGNDKTVPYIDNIIFKKLAVFTNVKKLKGPFAWHWSSRKNWYYSQGLGPAAKPDKKSVFMWHSYNSDMEATRLCISETIVVAPVLAVMYKTDFFSPAFQIILEKYL